MLLGSWYRKASLEHFDAGVEKPFSWGSASDFSGLMHELGLEYAGISSDGSFGGQPATHPIFDLENALNNEELTLIRYGDPAKRRELIRKKMPDLMSFRSTPGYADVAVRKSLAEKIRKRE